MPYYTLAMSRPHFLQPLLKRAAEGLVLKVEGRDTPVATTVESAFDSSTRKRGLLGRDALAPEVAFVIAPCSGVHTFGMRFPIDLIFAARDGRVIKLRRAVPASRISLGLRAFAVVEMAASGVVPGSGDRDAFCSGGRIVLWFLPCPAGEPSRSH